MSRAVVHLIGLDIGALLDPRTLTARLLALGAIFLVGYAEACGLSSAGDWMSRWGLKMERPPVSRHSKANPPAFALGLCSSTPV